MIQVQFEVFGRPRPQGSKRHIGGGRMIESSKALGPWRRDVKAAAKAAMDGHPPLSGPVEIRLEFRFPRPKCHYGTGRNWYRMKDKSPIEHTQRPDLDKLVRAILDSCSGSIFQDDQQVRLIEAKKDWCHNNTSGGVVVTVSGGAI